MAAITKIAYERLQKKYDKLEAHATGLSALVNDQNRRLVEQGREIHSLDAELEQFHSMLDELPNPAPRVVREDGRDRVLSITTRYILSKH